jgi:uncharacterized protein (DUF1810 family)
MRPINFNLGNYHYTEPGSKRVPSLFGLQNKVKPDASAPDAVDNKTGISAAPARGTRRFLFAFKWTQLGNIRSSATRAKTEPHSENSSTSAASIGSVSGKIADASNLQRFLHAQKREDAAVPSELKTDTKTSTASIGSDSGKTADPYNLQRFLDAQKPDYAVVQRELKTGRKSTHWMWYVFPQIKGLGSTPMSQHYGIASLDEAKAYLAHPVLGPRLRECSELALGHKNESVEEIFGPVDAMKFRSSMTLFAKAAEDNDLFVDCVRKCPGGADNLTLKKLGY